MDVEKSNKIKGLSPDKLKEIDEFYHHSAYDRSENKNLYDEYYVYPYVGRFGIGLKIKMPLSCEVRYYIFKRKEKES